MKRRNARHPSPWAPPWPWVGLLVLAASGCGSYSADDFCDDFCDECGSGLGFESHTESCEDSCNRSLRDTQRDAEARGCDEELGDWLACRSEHERCDTPATKESVAACEGGLQSFIRCVQAK
jgi:hypothetical protein